MSDGGRLQYLQMGIAGIVLQTAHPIGGIKECQSLSRSELLNAGLIEAFLSRHYKMLHIIMENQSHDAPKIVYPVGVKEIHAPPFARRRKAAQEKDVSVLGQKGLQRMCFNSHIPAKINKKHEIRSNGICQKTIIFPIHYI